MKYKKRLEICKGNDEYYPCEYYEPKLARCKKCGCFLKIKAKIKSMKCPIDKW